MKASIIGCGGIAQVHAEILSAIKDVKIISAADTDIKKANAMADKYGCAAYSDLYSLISNEKPDVLHICTPHYTHAPLAYTALSKGIHVLLEKPICMLPGEIDVLIAASSKEAAPILGICFQNRYNESSLRARQIIESGAAGEILGIRAFVSWSRDSKYYAGTNWRGSRLTEGGGALINQSIHTIDLMHMLVGREPIRIDGNIFNASLKNDIDVEDTASIYFDYGKGLTAILHATNSYAVNKDVMLEIECSKSVIRIEGSELSIIKSTGIEKLNNSSETKEGKFYWGQSHKFLINDFYNKISSGEKFAIDSTESSKALKTVFKIYEAAQNLNV